MITLYHCEAARSFRPLWMLEELGLPYELLKNRAEQVEGLYYNEASRDVIRV